MPGEKVETGSFGKDFQKGSAWGNIAGGLLSAYTDYRIAKSNERIADITGRIMDNELKLAATQEMIASRDAAKVRRKALDEALSARVIQNAMSGFKMEGSPQLLLAQEAEVAADDEAAARRSLKWDLRARERGVEGKKREMKSDVRKQRTAALSQARESLINSIMNAPL